MSDSAMSALIEKYGRGYLDTELQEKVRAMNPDLTARSFRFLADVGVKAISITSDSQFIYLVHVEKCDRTWKFCLSALHPF